MSYSIQEIKELLSMGFTQEQITEMTKKETKNKKQRKEKNKKPTEKKREGQKATRSLLKEEVELMFQQFKTDDQRLMFKILLNLSLRVSDAIDLTVGQLVGKKTARVYIKKQKRWMNILINDALKEAIELYLDHSLTEDDYIFQSRERSPKPGKEGTKKAHISRTTAWRWMKNAAKSSGIELGDGETIACHGIRKFFGTEANNQGLTIADIQTAYGHSNPQTTIRYLGIDESKVAKMRDNIQG